MPSDIDAVVRANTRLSDDYCIVALDAPEIAAAAAPGQFVMVKTSRGMDPLLRRPFSIFEILRDDAGALNVLDDLPHSVPRISASALRADKPPTRFGATSRLLLPCV